MVKHKVGFLLLLFFALFFLSGAGCGQKAKMPQIQIPSRLELVSTSFWTGANDVYLQGKYAFLAFNPGLVVVDISNPKAPNKVAQLPLDGRPVFIHGNKNLVALSTEFKNIVWLVDISKANKPRLVASIRLSEESGPPFLTSEFLFIIDGEKGLNIYDLSDIKQGKVRLRSRLNLEMAFGRVTVIGDIAYLATDDGFWVVDVSNIDRPKLRGFLNTAIGEQGLAVSGKRAYVASEKELLVIDISNSGNPALLDKQPLMVTGEEVEIADLALNSRALYVASGATGLLVYDLADPDQPVYTSKVPTVRSMDGIDVRGKIACVADELRSMVVLDVSRAVKPRQIGVFKTVNEHDGVQVVGDYAYLAMWTDGLRIADVSDPANPRLVGEAGYDSLPYGLALRLEVADGVAYLADGGMEPEVPLEEFPLDYEAKPAEAGVLIVDVAKPTKPKVLTRIFTPGEAFGVAVEGTQLYVADGSALRLYDVSDPSRPKALGVLKAKDEQSFRDVAASGTTVYVADEGTPPYIHIVDARNPVKPKVVSSIRARGEPEHLLVRGSRLYAGLATDTEAEDGTGGLEIYDVGNSARPRQLGFLPIKGETWGVALSEDGTWAVATDRWGYVQLIDVRQPKKPKVLDIEPTVGYPFSVWIANDYVYVSDYVALTIYRAH
jgi:hypothetical protein